LPVACLRVRYRPSRPILSHCEDDILILPPSRLSVNPECVSAFNELKLGSRGSGPKYIIYKISDDQKEIVVDEIGKETDYDVFREKLISKKDPSGKDRPSYAIYDVEFELAAGEGKRSKIAFITYINQDNTGVKVCNRDVAEVPFANKCSLAWSTLAPVKPSRTPSTALL
jgi:hypothetical protein